MRLFVLHVGEVGYQSGVTEVFLIGSQPGGKEMSASEPESSG